MDSSSLTASPVPGPVGSTARKRVDAIKHHVLVDSAAILVAAAVTAANVQDRSALPRLRRQAKPVAPSNAHAWVHNGYTGSTVADAPAKTAVTIDVVSGPKPARGFIVAPRRWVIEHTNGRINHCRHLDRHYQDTLTAHQGFLILSQIALPLRRLDQSPLIDTL